MLIMHHITILVFSTYVKNFEAKYKRKPAAKDAER